MLKYNVDILELSLNPLLHLIDILLYVLNGLGLNMVFISSDHNNRKGLIINVNMNHLQNIYFKIFQLKTMATANLFPIWMDSLNNDCSYLIKKKNICEYLYGYVSCISRVIHTNIEFV